ncbi:uncharacterized protein CEXT_793591 [Caerostris extrusa]|uniref:Uncharacterized protein n=1 Tax=Caerostris extrusa TaxID=172846 RepID=A0AAV4QNK9_CAEEX|nr:uncharacterized protein CEXT_793591 [Caerostris extrusa]
MAERQQHVTIPLMVRREDDIQFVEDELDTVSDNDVSSAQTSPMLERKLSARKKSNHDYEKLSVNSNSSSKRSTVERIAGSFRRRDPTHEKKLN